MRKDLQKVYEKLKAESEHGDVPIESIVKWIKAFAVPVQAFNFEHSSYGIKHIAEECFDSYITNEDMKIAMLEAGFIPYNPNELNWNFCLSKKSPMFIIDPARVYEFKKSEEVL